MRLELPILHSDETTVWTTEEWRFDFTTVPSPHFKFSVIIPFLALLPGVGNVFETDIIVRRLYSEVVSSIMKR